MFTTRALIRVFGAAPVLCAVLARPAIPADQRPPLRIDITDPEGERLDALPGILDEEIEILRGAAETGGDLGARLLATGIAADRLREWAPYLVVPALRPRTPAWSCRGRMVWQGVRISSEQIALRIAAARIEGDLRSRAGSLSTLPENEGGDRPHIDEARVGVVFGEDRRLTLGSLSAGLRGGDPWDDPVGRGSPDGLAIPAVVMRHDAASRGLLYADRRLTLSVWTDRSNRVGTLMALIRRGSSLWIGLRERDGRGAGVAYKTGAWTISGGLHLPKDLGPSVRVAASGDPSALRGPHLSVTVPLRPRADGTITRISAGVSRPVGSCLLRLKLASRLRPAAAGGGTRGEAVIRPAKPHGTSFLLGGSWGERSLRIQGTGERVLDRTFTFRITGRARSVGKARGVGVEILASTRRPSLVLELSLLGQSRGPSTLPGLQEVGSADRFAARADLRFSRPHLSTHVRATVPFGIGHLPRDGSRGSVGWRVDLEYRAN